MKNKRFKVIVTTTGIVSTEIIVETSTEERAKLLAIDHTQDVGADCWEYEGIADGGEMTVVSVEELD